MTLSKIPAAVFVSFCMITAGPLTAQIPTAENTEPLCQDGMDNDADSFVDCKDQDCYTFVACIAEARSSHAAAGDSGSRKAAAVTLPEMEWKDKGGIGIYANLVPVGFSKDVFDPGLDAKYKYKFSGGVGLFGEFLPLRYLAIGFELLLAFPEISHETRWESAECTDCHLSYRFSMLFRIKFPIQAHRLLAIYFLVAFGPSYYKRLLGVGDSMEYFGLCYSPGLGIEFYPHKYFTPLLETRYFGAAEWFISGDEDSHVDMGIYHSFIINVGIRFL